MDGSKSLLLLLLLLLMDGLGRWLLLGWGADHRVLEGRHGGFQRGNGGAHIGVDGPADETRG
jgi:hypothetical protein